MPTSPMEETPLLTPRGATPLAPSRSALRALGGTVAMLLVLAVYLQVMHTNNERSLESPMLLAGAGPPLNSYPTFLAVGDWGRGGIAPQRKVAGALAVAANGTRRPMVLSTGDNFYSRGVRNVHDEQWTQSYESVYGRLPELQRIPFLVVLGNHDHKGDAMAQVKYTRHSPTWDLPSRFNVRMVAPRLMLLRLDTTPYVHDKAGRAARGRGWHPQPQTAWVAKALAEAARRRIFVLVVGHHNMYTASTCGHFGTNRVRRAVEPLLRRHRRWVLAYVSGHEHNLMHMRMHGIDHVISGGGSLLDPVCKPRHMKHKLRKKGVVTGSHVRFAQSTNGFFKIHFDAASGLFEAVAINSDNRVIYTFRKKIPL